MSNFKILIDLLNKQDLANLKEMKFDLLESTNKYNYFLHDLISYGSCELIDCIFKNKLYKEFTNNEFDDFVGKIVVYVSVIKDEEKEKLLFDYLKNDFLNRKNDFFTSLVSSNKLFNEDVIANIPQSLIEKKFELLFELFELINKKTFSDNRLFVTDILTSFDMAKNKNYFMQKAKKIGVSEDDYLKKINFFENKFFEKLNKDFFVHKTMVKNQIENGNLERFSLVWNGLKNKLQEERDTKNIALKKNFKRIDQKEYNFSEWFFMLLKTKFEKNKIFFKHIDRTSDFLYEETELLDLSDFILLKNKIDGGLDLIKWDKINSLKFPESKKNYLFSEMLADFVKDISNVKVVTVKEIYENIDKITAFFKELQDNLSDDKKSFVYHGLLVDVFTILDNERSIKHEYDISKLFDYKMFTIVHDINKTLKPSEELLKTYYKKLSKVMKKESLQKTFLETTMIIKEGNQKHKTIKI